MYVRSFSISALLLVTSCTDPNLTDGGDVEADAQAAGAGHTPTVPPIGCEVTEGPNKGKKGTRTEDGWCEGDWGGTECRPRSKCKDIPNEGSMPPDVTLTPNPQTTELVNTGNAVVGIVPAVGAGAVEYCKRSGTTLGVAFENTGTVSSPAGTEVVVTFDTRNGPVSLTQERPSIPAGGMVEMAYEMPALCFSPDCEFTVEWSNQPAVGGRCIG